MQELLNPVEKISLNQLKDKFNTMEEENTIWRDNSGTIMNWPAMLGILKAIAAIIAAI